MTMAVLISKQNVPSYKRRSILSGQRVQGLTSDVCPSCRLGVVPGTPTVLAVPGEVRQSLRLFIQRADSIGSVKPVASPVGVKNQLKCV